MARKQLVPLDMDNSKIINLATPTVGTDAATKDYVDSSGGGSGEGLIIPPHYKTSNFTASFAESFYVNVRAVDNASVQVELPEPTVDDIGKAFFFTNNSSVLSNFSVEDWDDTHMTVQSYSCAPGEFLIMVAKATTWPNRWESIFVKSWQPDIDAINGQLPYFVTYTGASSDVDLAGNALIATSLLGPPDSGISLGASVMLTPDIDAPDITIAGASPIGNGNGGRVSLAAGPADTTTIGAVGNGGTVYIQTGQAGEAGGTPGIIELRQGGKTEYATISLDSLANDVTYELSDMSGKLLTGNGTNGITVGTTAPATPAIGDLWYDTN